MIPSGVLRIFSIFFSPQRRKERGGLFGGLIYFSRVKLHLFRQDLQDLQDYFDSFTRMKQVMGMFQIALIAVENRSHNQITADIKLQSFFFD